MATRWFSLGVGVLLLTATGCSRSDSDAAIRAVVNLTGDVKSNCIRLAVTSGEFQQEKLSEPLPRGNQSTFVFALYRDLLPVEVKLTARGYVGANDCEGQLLLNDEGEPVDALFDTQQTSEVSMTLAGVPAAVDGDADGYRASAAGGPDCDDSVYRVNPGVIEDCADERDDNCNGLVDCADTVCANRACSTGVCQGTTCVTGPAEIACGNGQDDDLDGSTDCQDSNCDTRECTLDVCVVGQCSAKACVNPVPRVCDEPPSQCHKALGTCSSPAGCSYAYDSGKPCDRGTGPGTGVCGSDGICQPLYLYTPSNFTPPKAGDYSEQVNLGGCSALLDTSDLSNPFTVWCGAVKPKFSELTISSPYGSIKALLLAMKGFVLPNGATLRIIGSRPVIFAVLGNVEINGLLDAAASSDTPQPGPGGGSYVACGNGSAGTNGQSFGGSGGGGGGAGGVTIGGSGGTAGTGAGGSAGGTADPSPSSNVLRAGCNGGEGGMGYSFDGAMVGGGAGGFGGGGVQISASGELWIRANAKLSVSGAGGLGGGSTGGSGVDLGSGGGGGGGGGFMLFEANTLNNIAGELTANGGGGGGGGARDASGNPGDGAILYGDTPSGGGGGGSGGSGGTGGGSPVESGNPASGSSGGGGGGGGADGIIRFRIRAGCAGKTNGSSSPQYTCGSN